MFAASARNFDEWRQMARALLAQDIRPDQVDWRDANTAQNGLFDSLNPLLPAQAGICASVGNGPQPALGKAGEGIEAAKTSENTFKIPKDFITLAERVACHRDAVRNGLLYLALWRLTHGEKHLLRLSTDPLVHQLLTMQKQVSRDAHKAKAFVRFRLADEDGEDHYIAWHNPDHLILPLVAPFFMRRFSVMKWTILTADQSVSWDGEKLLFGEGVPRSKAPDKDVLEDMWRAYYRSTFNPARIKLKMMRSEMPVRHWATLPETSIIADMLKEAPDRVAEMLKYSEGIAGSAADFLPAERDISALRLAAKTCQGCPLYQCATQTVFGVGPENAQIMIVGEQPGAQEDKAGEPFVGPAGQVLNDALREAGVDRDRLYLTNAVKHFKNRRSTNVHGDEFLEHVTPDNREITACKPWLVAEIAAIRPRVILCLGATAGRALLGPGFTLKNQLGKWVEMDGKKILCTYHPSAVLRMPDAEQKAKIFQQIVQDLQKALANILT